MRPQIDFKEGENIWATQYFAYICTCFVHLRIVMINLLLGDGLAAQMKILNLLFLNGVIIFVWKKSNLHQRFRNRDNSLQMCMQLGVGHQKNKNETADLTLNKVK